MINWVLSDWDSPRILDVYELQHAYLVMINRKPVTVNRNTNIWKYGNNLIKRKIHLFWWSSWVYKRACNTQWLTRLIFEQTVHISPQKVTYPCNLFRMAPMALLMVNLMWLATWKLCRLSELQLTRCWTWVIDYKWSWLVLLVGVSPIWVLNMGG